MNIPMQNTVADYYTAHYTSPEARRHVEPTGSIVKSLGALVSPPMMGLGTPWGYTPEQCVAQCQQLLDPSLPKASAALFDSCVADCEPFWYQRPAVAAALGIATLASAAAGAYHGYKRNDSVGWGVGWFFLAGWFWPIAVPVMFAQGFGERKRG